MNEKLKEKFVDERWTKTNEPVGYIVGVTPGFSQFEQGEEKLTNMGLARKIMKAARLGFDFCQIDYEALSEMFEADIKEQIAHIKNSQGNIDTGRKFEVGLHLQTDLDLCIAGAYEWKIMHERLTKGAYSARKLVEAKYYLFHTSSRIRPHVTFDVGQQEPRVALYSFDGKNLAQFMQEVDDGAYVDPARGPVTRPSTTPDGVKIVSMQDWFMGRFITILFNAMGAPADVSSVGYFDDFMLEKNGSGFEEGVKKNQLEAERLSEEKATRVNKLRHDMTEPHYKRLRELEQQKEQRLMNKQPTVDIDMEIQNTKRQIDEYGTYTAETHLYHLVNKQDPDFEQRVKEVETTRAYLERTDFNQVFDFWRRHGSEAEEQVAYRIIAKYMWLTHDPLWADIVGMQYDPDQITWRNELGYEYYSKGKKTEEKNGPPLKILVEKLITAVAAKYIQGHLFVKHERWSMKVDDKDLTSDMSVYEYTKESGMKIYIETAMPPQGQEGQLRIMSANDHVKLVKNLDKGEITSYCLDFEHLTVNYIRVNEDVESLKDGDAKYITMVHINAPRPIMGAHAPIDRLSRDMQVIYRWLYLMRQKGMKNSYLIWEMGSYGVRESAVAFRNLMHELSKGTDPLKLPKEFYGIDEMFEQQQWVNMREHAYDALKGVIANPEEDHGLLSTEAVKKNKLTEWLAGRYK
ncbi:MAG: hypothetical protein U9Q92_00575 [archaeon]|nr:hypothetical protein [archaeon]